LALLLSHCPDGSRPATHVSFTETRVSAHEEPQVGEFEPTFKYSGCYDIQNPDEHRVKGEAISGMTPTKCFSFCQGKAAPAEAQPTNTTLDVKFFLLRNGDECSCLHYVDKDPASANDQYCTDKCNGDPREMCGGVSHESVYVMIKCEILPPSATEVEREKQMNAALENAK